MSQVTKLGPGGYPVAKATTLRTLTLQASPGTYTVTGSSAALLVGHVVAASPGSYTVTGASARLIEGHKLQAASGAYSITGSAAALLRGSVVNASPGAYTITGASANLVKAGTLVLQAAPGAYTITGASANLVYTSKAVKPDIDSVLTPKQLHELRRRLAEQGKRRQRDFEREADARTELRTTLESFFRVAEPEQVEEIKEKLPVIAETRTEIGAHARKSPEFHARIDWPKLYDDRALMEGLTRDLSKILADHLERQRFEREEDDLAILMLA